jgi:PHD/YefM family antitoxin component YafN of YafNO toxin-antitoxin module
MGTAVRRSAVRRPPELVLRAGKPAAVILDIEHYREMLERLDDVDDLRYLRRLRQRPLHFKKLDRFLAKMNARV